MLVDRSVNTQRETFEPPELDQNGSRPDDKPDDFRAGRSFRGEEEEIKHVAHEQYGKP